MRAFDLTFEGSAYSAEKQSNDFDARYRFLEPGYVRMTRAFVLESMSEDYIRTARAKGLTRSRVLFRHLLANALPPLVVLLMLALPGVVAGSVFVESIFAWPGMGRVMLEAISARDYPVVMGATVVYATLVVLANAASDVLLHAVDPRRRV